MLDLCRSNEQEIQPPHQELQQNSSKLESSARLEIISTHFRLPLTDSDGVTKTSKRKEYFRTKTGSDFITSLSDDPKRADFHENAELYISSSECRTDVHLGIESSPVRAGAPVQLGGISLDLFSDRYDKKEKEKFRSAQVFRGCIAQVRVNSVVRTNSVRCLNT
jgi:hypothetical protein